MTQLEQAQAGMLAFATQQVKALNDDRIVRYLGNGSDISGTWPDWKASIDNGHGDITKPPTPPLAWVVGKVLDPTTEGPDVVGSAGPVYWDVPVLGTAPVCPMPALPVAPVVVQAAFKVGTRIYGDMFRCLSGDTTKAQEAGVAQSADGVVGVFKKVGGQFGVGSFYYILIEEMK
jgi:hypothetical protein